MLLIKEEEEEAQIAPAPAHTIKKTKDTMHVVDVQQRFSKRQPCLCHPINIKLYEAFFDV